MRSILIFPLFTLSIWKYIGVEASLTIQPGNIKYISQEKAYELGLFNRQIW